MTITYPDISGYQGNIDLTGVPAACAKVTEGTGFVSPWYDEQKAMAARHGVFFFAYHFLHHGAAAAQAGWCHAHAAKTPVMVDFEPTGSSNPSVADATAFIDTYRKDGGISNLVYLPHWYWLQLGAPDLKPLRDRGMHLVSSAYPASTYQGDHASGWNTYGGMSPAIWQYTSSQVLHGQRVDFNAYRGTLAQLEQLVLGHDGPSGPVMPVSVLLLGSQGSDVRLLQSKLANSGIRGVRGITVDGVFGQQTDTAVRNFQLYKGLHVDGIVGPATWPAVWAL